MAKDNVIPGSAGGEAEQAAAWRDAGPDRPGMPAPTGDSVATIDAERDRIRAMTQRRETAEPEIQRRSFRQPAGAAEQPAAPAAAPADESFAPEAQPEPENRLLYESPLHRASAHAPEPPPAPAEEPAAAAPAADDEGARLERELLLGERQDAIPELPDTRVKIGGVELPLSRIRSGLEALSQKDEWQRSLTQRQQALAHADQMMIEAAKDLKRDSVGSLEKLGVSPEQLLEQLRQRGLAVDKPATPHGINELPEDADPIAKGLLVENRALKQKIAALDGDVQGVKAYLSENDRRARAAALESQRLAALSGAKSFLTDTALKMPSMRGSDGKLTPAAKLLVETATTRLGHEVGDAQVDASAIKGRARELFGTIAREVGVVPTKTEQARRAMGQRKAPVPTHPGTTLPQQPISDRHKPGSFDFSNDDARRSAMDAWFARNLAEQE